MTAMPAIDDHFSLIELDDMPSRARREPPATVATTPDERMALLDLVDNVKAPVCLDCARPGTVNDLGICSACYTAHLRDHATPAELEDDFGSPVDQLQSDAQFDLSAIAAESASNANVQGAAAADGAGRLPIVGFRTRDGYVQALRNGVTASTYQSYIDLLRTQYGMTSAEIYGLALPPPMAGSALPEGKGIVHTPTGPSIFDRPRAERAFIVAPKQEQLPTRVNTAMKASELVAGAAAAGNHAISAWEGTTGMLRGDLVAALAAIGREAWAPNAPNARAQAGRAINKFCKRYDVKPVRKGTSGAELVVNEHMWTVGRVEHQAQVGAKYGEIVVRFRLAGDTLSYEGNSAIAEPVIAEFDRRMQSEEFNSDVTSWLKRTLRLQLNGVKFGAMGFLIPAGNVAIAKELTEALAKAGFGSDWVHSMPVADGPQLKDGIVRGLVNEVVEELNELRKERAAAKAEREEAHAVAIALADPDARDKALAQLPRGDIGDKRREAHIRELRVVYTRVKAYGEVLGESRVDEAERWLRDALAELENLAADDYDGASERFRLIFEELRDEAARAGGAS